MSNFVERTFGSLNTILHNSNLFGNSDDKTLCNSSRSKFPLPWATEYTFIERLKNSESKREEEEEIKAFTLAAEKRLSQIDVTNAEIQRIVKHCMVCERLGYPVPFAYVHAIKLAQKGNLQEKHTGYLASTCFLHPQHELVILLINTMQKDLCSSNHVAVLLSLTSVCNLINSDTVHHVIHLVEDRLKHKMPSVRKLAVLTLGHCLGLVNSPSSYQMALPKLEKSLTDSELDVVSAAVPTLYNIIQKLPGDYTYLLNAIINLQNQILQRRVPSDMKYHDIPAPWLQIHILKLLAAISQNTEASERIVDTLKNTLLQAEVKHFLAYAIIQETIETVTNSKPNAEMTQLVLSSIQKFIKSRNFNLKLIGMEALISFVKKVEPSIDASQQEIIMECLKQPDETLQLKTLELLYQLANSSNVQAICKRLIEFMISRKEDCSRKRLALNVLELASRYKENKIWYVSIVNTILTESGTVLSSSDINSIIAVIEKDDVMRETAKKTYLDMHGKKFKFSSAMIKLVATVLTSLEEFQELLPNLIEEADESSSLWLLVSLQHMLLLSKETPLHFNETLKKLPNRFQSVTEVLNQICCIIECGKDIENFNFSNDIDPSLSFLDEYVVKSLEEGSSCYHPQSLRSVALLAHEDFKPENSSASSSKASFVYESDSMFTKSPIYNALGSPSISMQSFSSDVDSKFSFSSESPLAKGDQATPQHECLEKDEAMKKECLELFAGVS